MSDIDLLINQNDLTLSGNGEPLLVTGRACVAQDMTHMIRENAYAEQMIANRNQYELARLAQTIEIKMEEDRRIVPGSARVTQVNNGQFIATARTRDYGPINFAIGSDS